MTGVQTCALPISLTPAVPIYLFIEHFPTNKVNEFRNKKSEYVILNNNLENINLHNLNFGYASIIEDITGDGIADYVYTKNDNVIRINFISDFKNSPPEIIGIQVNADKSKLCYNYTYIFTTTYKDIDNDATYYKTQCSTIDQFNNYSENPVYSPINTECNANYIGQNVFRIKLKGLFSENVEKAYQVNYEVINNLPPDCALPFSGNTNLSIREETTGSTTKQISPSFGLEEFANQIGWSNTNKALFVIILIIFIILFGISKAKDVNGEIHSGIYPLLGIVVIGIIYFGYKIGWVSGFALMLFFLLSIIFLVYKFFGMRGQ